MTSPSRQQAIRRRGSAPALPRLVAAIVAVCLIVAGCGSSPSASPGSSPGTGSSAARASVPIGSPVTGGTSLAPGASRGPASLPAAAGASGPLVASVSPLRLPVRVSRAVAFAAGGTVLLAGGLTPNGTTSTILRIDPRAAKVSPVGRLARPVHDAGTAALGSSALVVGGGDLVAESIVQRVSAGGSAIVSGHLPAPRADLAAVSADGQVVVAGGGTTGGPDSRVLATSDGATFRSIGRLMVGVRYPAVVASGGPIYVIGGTDGVRDSAAVQAIDPGTGQVRLIGRLPQPLSHAAAVDLGGRIVIAGGRTSGRAQAELWLLDPATGVVTSIGRLPYAVSDVAAVVLDGVGYLIGGEASGPLDSIVTLRFA